MDFYYITIKGDNLLNNLFNGWPNGFRQVVIELEPVQDRSQADELPMKHDRAPPIIHKDAGIGDASVIDQGVLGDPDNTCQLIRNGFRNLDQSAEQQVERRGCASRHGTGLDAAQDDVSAEKWMPPRGDHQLRSEQKDQNARSRWLNRPGFPGGSYL